MIIMDFKKLFVCVCARARAHAREKNEIFLNWNGKEKNLSEVTAELEFKSIKASYFNPLSNEFQLYLRDL